MSTGGVLQARSHQCPIARKGKSRKNSRTTRALITALTVFLMPWIGLSAAMESPPEPIVDEIFAEFDRPDVPGCALGVIHDGKFVYRRGYGMANLEYDIPISSRSVFRIASVSKQFTAMAVALLAESGQISLEDPLSKYFPEFPGWANTTRVSQLVHHTSGIRDYLTLADLAGKVEDTDYFSDDWAIALLARQEEVDFPPGSRFLYSNSGYFLLAHLVKRVTGQSLKDFSEKNIFTPLGMHNSHFHDDHKHIVKQRAAGYSPSDEGFSIDMTTLDIVGDGSVYTTLDDLLLWDSNFYHNRLGSGGQDLISRVTKAGLLNNGEPAAERGGPSVIDGSHYAFGLKLEQYRGLPMIGHGGAYAGFRSAMIRFPEQRFSVVVLCNRSDSVPTKKARLVADFYLADYLDPLPKPDLPNQAVHLSEEQLQRYAGDFWEHSDAFAAETRVIDGKLWAVHSPGRRNELVPLGDDRFKMAGLPMDVIVEYAMTDSGIGQVIRLIDGYPSGVFEPFTRRQVNRAELGVYTGEYYSAELDVLYSLRMEEGILVFQLPWQKPRELTPMFGETFENPDWGAFEFRRGPQGSITGFTLQSGSIRNLWFLRK